LQTIGTTPVQFFQAGLELANYASLPQSTSQERLHDAAMKALKAAVDAGFRDLDLLNDSESLRPLRIRPDFKELLKRMESTNKEAPVKR
jgi:hypothetical protein